MYINAAYYNKVLLFKPGAAALSFIFIFCLPQLWDFKLISTYICSYIYTICIYVAIYIHYICSYIYTIYAYM